MGSSRRYGGVGSLTEDVKIRPADAVGTIHSRPRVVWWAWLGVVFVAIETVAIIGWVANGHATPTHAIAADVPSYAKISAIIIQAICVLTCIGVVTYVVRQCWRQRTLTFAGVITIVGTSLWWQDSLMNYIRPQAGYNSYYVNLGSLNSDVPGWLSPNGHVLPEGLLLELTIYISMLLYAELGATAMRTARSRWPTISVAALIAVGFGTLALFNVVSELAINIPSRSYGWSSTIGWLTLFGNETYRYPVYEGILSAFVFAPSAMLLFFLDDRGRSVVEQGIERVRGGSAKRNAIRLLAVAGFLNLCFLGYNIPINWIALHTDRHYTLPSYISNDMCGLTLANKCPEAP
jgi:hypothetical protein